jgi:hypothetical protein
MTRPKASERLATAVAGLPRPLRAAMLAAVRRERIITGAFADGDGMCPLLGAHRYGVREGGTGFADAWDGFCRPRRGRRRDATASEREVLIELLEKSLFGDVDRPAAPAPRRAPRVRPVAAGR